MEVLSVYIVAIFIFPRIDAVPPEACFSNFRWDDCGKPPTPVMYYWKPASRCEVGLWRGCLPNLNMFGDEYECVTTCIFTSRAMPEDYHSMNENEIENIIEDTTPVNISGVDTSIVDTTGVKIIGVDATGVNTTGVDTTGVDTTGIVTTENSMHSNTTMDNGTNIETTVGTDTVQNNTGT